MHRVVLAPSILAADHSRLGEEIAAVEAAGADWLHLDVMDGHFVPNLTFGPPVIAALRKRTKLVFDVHLMIEHPERSLEQYLGAGADYLTVHAEACVHLHRTLAAIRQGGAKAGVALNPATPTGALDHVYPLLDLVLVMSVNPGFGGQEFIPAVVPKLPILRGAAAVYQPDLRISIDGGIDARRVAELTAAGADVFVAGSAVFGSRDYHATLTAMRRAAAASRG